MSQGTERPVQLRQWRDDDLPGFAEMNADPEVMRFFPKTLGTDESKAMMNRLRDSIEQRGWGFWAVEVVGEFAGFVGLAQPSFSAHFTPCVEIGWRLRRKFWGQGIAFTAAREAEAFAFSTLGLAELVTFTAELNLRSQRLMERLGFTATATDRFLHPLVPEGHPLRPHVLYRKKRASTQAR